MTPNRNPASQSNRTEDTPSSAVENLTVEIDGVTHNVFADDAFDPHDEYQDGDGDAVVECDVVVVWPDRGSRTVGIDWGLTKIDQQRLVDGLERADHYFDWLKERVDYRRRGRVGILRYNLDTHECWYIPDDENEDAVQLPSERK